MVDLLIPGPEGKIEAKYSHSKNDDSPCLLYTSDAADEE